MANEEENEKSKFSAPALEKGLDIIESLSERPEGMTMNQLTYAMHKSRSEISRMVGVLYERGYLDYSQQSHEYRLSHKLFALSHRYTHSNRLIDIANPAMAKLARDIKQACHLVICARGECVVLSERESGINTLHVSVPIGGTGPLMNNCSGHVFLSFSKPDTQARILDDAKRIHNQQRPPKEALDKLVDRVRAQGFENMESPVVEGVHDIGYPVFDHTGDVTAVLMVSHLRFIRSKNKARMENYHQNIKKCAAQISKRLGSEREQTV